MYSKKNSNVATIRGAFGALSYAAIQVISYLTGFFLFTLSLAIDSKIENTPSKMAWKMATIFSIALIAISVAAIVRLVIVKTASIYFIGNEMYIKNGKDSYLKVLPEEIDEYSWNTCASRSFYSAKGKNYSNVLYWGYLNIVVDGIT